MSKFSNKVDKMISEILNEEIESKVNKIVEEFGEGEWKEIEVGEELHGGQKKLDKNKNGKIDAEDFKLLRKKKKESHESEDEQNENWGTVARIAAPMVASYVMDKIGEEEEELDEEGETEEGNAFTGALAKAKEEGDDSFEVDGKKYHVKEDKKEKKWIQKTEMKKGALHKKLGIPEGDKIPVSKLKSLKAELSKKAEGDKKLSASDSKLLKQVNLALTLKNIKEEKNSLKLTESELIDMIERIVLEQEKKEKNNIGKKSPVGLKKTEKVQGLSKKENEDYAKEVVKKMKDYLKDGSNGEFKENPEEFPQSNYQMKKDEKIQKYHPSQAVEEYIEAFAYPGQTNLVFDEIKPDDKKIEKYLKGDSTTGNATTDKDGKALGNVVPSKVGDRFKKNYDENLYGAEQMKGSYKRQPQPVDVGGSEKLEGSLKSIRKGSMAKSNKIMSQLESVDKKKKVVNEELEKMKTLITYNRKTQ